MLIYASRTCNTIAALLESTQLQKDQPQGFPGLIYAPTTDRTEYVAQRDPYRDICDGPD